MTLHTRLGHVRRMVEDTPLDVIFTFMSKPKISASCQLYLDLNSLFFFFKVKETSFIIDTRLFGIGVEKTVTII